MTEPTGTSGAGDQLIGAGAEDRPHRPVEPLEAPALGEAIADQAVDLGAAGVGAGDDVVEEVMLGVVIAGVLDRRAKPMIVEFLEQPGQRRALHLLLVQRLDGGEAGGGTRTGTGLAHAAAAVAAASAQGRARARRRPSSPASHGAKWPASGRRSMRGRRPAPRAHRAGAEAAPSFMPQITSVGTLTLGKAPQQQVGQRHGHARRRDDHLRAAVPVEHRAERARLRPVGDILLPLRIRDFRDVDVAGEGRVEEPVEAPSPRPSSRSPACGRQ